MACDSPSHFGGVSTQWNVQLHQMSTELKLVLRKVAAMITFCKSDCVHTKRISGGSLQIPPFNKCI